MTSSLFFRPLTTLSLNEMKELVKFFFSAVLACGIIWGPSVLVWGIIYGIYWWINSEPGTGWTRVSGGMVILILLSIMFILVFLPVIFTIEKYGKMIAHKSKLEFLLNKATRLDRTGDSVALLLQRMEEGVKVGCAGKYLSWPIENRIREASEKLAVEYREGQEDLEELLDIASDFKYLVSRRFLAL